MNAPITIRGAGPVGLAFALFAHAQGIAVTVREAKSRAAWQAANVGNGRSVALAHGSRQLLERIHPDGWAAIAAASAAPIRTIHVEQAQGFVAESERAARLRTELLHKMISQLRNVLDSFSQRRQLDRYH